MRAANGWQDYELIDATDGNRLERWGDTLLVRPDPQVVWKTGQTSPLWSKANAVYHRSAKGGGQWEYRRKMPDKWQIRYRDLQLVVSPTGFKHTGVSPNRQLTGIGTPKKLGSRPRRAAVCRCSICSVTQAAQHSPVRRQGQRCAMWTPRKEW